MMIPATKLIVRVFLLLGVTLASLPLLLLIAQSSDTLSVNAAEYQSSSQIEQMNSQDYTSMSVEQLSSRYQQLKNITSHFDERPHDNATTANTTDNGADVDTFNGEKHQVMMALGDKLGWKGTKWEQLLDAMGEPDEITHDLDNPYQSAPFMPGPVIPEGSPPADQQEGDVYLLYYWRGRHDFLWFQMAESSEIIQKSDWHYTQE